LIILIGKNDKLWSYSLSSIFFNHLSPHLSSAQVYSPAPCSQTPSVCVHPLILKTEPQAKL
jgi:hypothetical protein